MEVNFETEQAEAVKGDSDFSSCLKVNNNARKKQKVNKNVSNLNRISTDTEVLTIIFPEEIWAKILENVTEGKDNENLNNTSPFFRRLLLQERVYFLFPSVFTVIALRHQKKVNPFEKEYYEPRPEEITSASDNEDDIIFVREANQLPKPQLCKNGILNMRLVCKTWCNGIETFYNEYPYNPKRYGVDQLQESIAWNKNVFGVSRNLFFRDIIVPWAVREKCAKFCGHFDESHCNSERNPFLGRRIFITMVGTSRDDLNEILIFLKKYGHHIWHLSLYISDIVFPTILYLFSELRKILKLVSNLRSLHIVVYPKRAERDVARMRIRRPEPRALKLEEEVALNHQINLNPLPVSQHLQTLITRDLYAPIFNELAYQNRHLSILEIDKGPFQQEYDVFLTPLPNLKQLEIQFYSVEDYDEFETSEMQFTLEKLRLDLGKMPFIEWPRVFGFLETKFKESLTDLEIVLPVKMADGGDAVEKCECGERAMNNWRFVKDCREYKLDLPKLKRIKLYWGNSVSTLDFILPMRKTMEILEVEIGYCSNGRKIKITESLENGQIVEYLGWSGQILKSNIWRMFPKLKQLRFFEKGRDGLCQGKEEVHVYTRKEWELKQNGMLGKA